jgi:basic membrane protein A and related proteins
MKKRLLAGIGVLALVLAACSSSDNGDNGAAAKDESQCGAELFCVGLVTDTGKVDDKSFNQSAWEGAQAAAEELDGFSKYIETVDPKDYATNMALFTDKKYDVIVTVGFLMAEATVAAAKANPEITFIGVDQFQGEEISNLTGLIFPEDKAGFMAGYLAGYLTQSDKVGAVLGTDVVPPVKKFGEGYKNGVAYAAKEQGKSIKTTLVYHAPDNAFNDPAWGASTARQQLDQGFDVIFGAGGNTGNGALQEIAKDAAKGAFCIGVDSDQWNTVPEAQPCLVTSAMKLITQGVSDLIKATADGTIAGGNYEGSVGLADYHDLASKVPADVQAKVSDVIAKVMSGEIPTGVKL